MRWIRPVCGTLVMVAAAVSGVEARPFTVHDLVAMERISDPQVSPDGRLVIVEDNVPSDIWFASDVDGDGVADSVELFASLSDYGAEGTGIYFNPKKSNTLYVNIQHSKVNDNDATWAITKGVGNDHKTEK